MAKLNTRTMEDILSEYTDYIVLLKETSLHQFKHKLTYDEYELCMHKDAEGNYFTRRLKKPPIDKDIANELIILERNCDSLKEAFDKILKESELEDDKFETDCIAWLSNNIFSDGYILTKDYCFAMLKFFQVDEDGYYFHDTCYHILCKIDGLVSDYEAVYYDVLRKIKSKVDELKKLIIG